MNKNFIPATNAILFSLALLATSFAFAQQGDDIIIQEDDSILIETSDTDTDKQAKQSSSASRISFSGEASGSYSGLISSNERYLGSLKLRYFQEFNQNLSVVVEGRAYTSGVKLDFFSRDLNNPEGDSTITRKITANKVELDEAYIRINSGFFDFYLGRRKLVLGQFDAFSPVDFVLPVDLSNSEVKFTKLESKYPQTTASLYLNLNSKLELQFHYFPFLERDPITRRLLETPESYYNGTEVVSAPFRRPKNTNQYLGRIVYTGERIIAGLTYYKGFALYTELMASLMPSENRPTLFVPEPSYPSFTGYGFEVSIPHKRFLFKYEALLGQRVNNFNMCSMPEDSTCSEYISFLTDNFNGKAYVNSDALLHGLGFDYLSENWTVNFALFNIIELRSNAEKRAQALSDEVSGGSTGGLGIVAPTANLSRHWGRNKVHTTGFAGGFFGNTFGATVYHSFKASDNLTLFFGAEIFAYRSDEQFEEQVDRDENASPDNAVDVTQTSLTTPGLRFGASYKF